MSWMLIRRMVQISHRCCFSPTGGLIIFPKLSRRTRKEKKTLKTKTSFLNPSSPPTTSVSVARIYYMYMSIVTFSTCQQYWMLSHALYPLNSLFQPVIKGNPRRAMRTLPQTFLFAGRRGRHTRQMFADKTDKSLACATDCWLQYKPSTAALQRPVRRINPDWVGWLEVQCGSRSVDHLFCWWLAGAFISFTLAPARSLCGWRLIARQHMVPLASDHSTTCLSNCCVPAPNLPLQLRRIHLDRP